MAEYNIAGSVRVSRTGAGPGSDKWESDEWESVWPPSQESRDSMVDDVAEKLLSEPTMTMSPEEAKEAARSIEADAHALYADARHRVKDGWKFLYKYMDSVSRLIADFVNSRVEVYPGVSSQIPAEETKQQVKVTAAGGHDGGSSSSSSECPFGYEFVLFKTKKKPPNERAPPIDRTPGFWKEIIPKDFNPFPDYPGFERPPPPDLKEILSSRSRKPPEPKHSQQPQSFTAPLEPVIFGQPSKLDIDGHHASWTHKMAAEAVKEYNNRQFKDKLELVKVTKGTAQLVYGYIFHLNFDAKSLGDQGGTVKAYKAEVLLKFDGTLKVLSFKFINDGHGKNPSTFFLSYID